MARPRASSKRLDAIQPQADTVTFKRRDGSVVIFKRKVKKGAA